MHGARLLTQQRLAPHVAATMEMQILAGAADQLASKQLLQERQHTPG